MEKKYVIAMVVIAILVAAGGFYLMLNLGGLSTCDSIKDPALRDNCKLNEVVFKGDLSDCENIESNDQKNGCYIYQAVAQHDVSICDLIEHPAAEESLRNLCISSVARITEDLTICDKLSEKDNGACISGVAIQKQDASICELVENPFVKDNCIAQVALITKDKWLCDRIEGTVAKNTCNSLT